MRTPSGLRRALERIGLIAPRGAADQASLPLSDVLQEEYARLRPRHARVDKPLSAICLSGGGIRSATFALGLIQGLARYDLLGDFDYLSTVSGGGYLGSWLTAWIHRRGSSQEVFEELKRGVTESNGRLEPEPLPIRYLRAYSNYLAPRLGLLSADTWTLVAIYLRSLLLNWLVIVPLLSAAILVPMLAVVAALLPMELPHLPWRAIVAVGFGVAFLSGVWAFRFAYVSLPTETTPQAATNGSTARRGVGQGRFLRYCLLPLAFATVMLATAWIWLALVPRGPQPVEGWVVPVLFGSFCGVAHLLGWLLAQRRLKDVRLGLAVIAALSGAIGGLLVYWLATRPFGALGTQAAPLLEWYVTLAAPVLLVLIGIAGTLYVGLTSRWGSDLDREWTARFGAWLLIVAVGWSAVSAIALFGPSLLHVLGWQLRALAGSLGGAAGIATLWQGFSAKTPGTAGKPATTPPWINYLTPVATMVFAVTIVVLLSVLDIWLLRWVAASGSCQAEPELLHCVGPWRAIALFVALVAFGLVAASFINTNRFSLHGMYRNRLIRAYLGASHTDRHPEPFTGFDEQDNIPMHQLWPTGAAPSGDSRKPFPVINMALNLAAGHELAWQERKAESFTVTPLHAGNHRLGYRRTYYPEISVGYGGTESGMSLGTAATISGAAASPNMGYHTSPVVAFLLTLFNVRLGWWGGNPGTPGNATFWLEYPRSAIRPIIDEAFGLTNDQNPYVYLSDGGHFDNLGLYEMVLRRCGLILVSDAGCDPHCRFEDLGNAIRKVRIDLGVPIEFERPMQILPRSEQRVGKYCALGVIRYSSVDHTPAKRDGVLIYVKPSLYGDEPRDVYTYAQTNEFPHETTADQFFSESQFESYRALGYHIASQVFGSPDSGRPLQERVDDYLRRQGP